MKNEAITVSVLFHQLTKNDHLDPRQPLPHESLSMIFSLLDYGDKNLSEVIAQWSGGKIKHADLHPKVKSIAAAILYLSERLRSYDLPPSENSVDS